MIKDKVQFRKPRDLKKQECWAFFKMSVKNTSYKRRTCSEERNKLFVNSHKSIIKCSTLSIYLICKKMSHNSCRFLQVWPAPCLPKLPEVGAKNCRSQPWGVSEAVYRKRNIIAFHVGCSRSREFSGSQGNEY
jgi:hypothetical protein